MNTYTCTPEEFLNNVKLPTRVMDSEEAMYEEMAEIMANTIEANGDDKTVIICPVGPIGHYPIFAKKINERRISCKNTWFINMDEYLDDNDKEIPMDSPLRFKATMERMLYSQIDKELAPPKEQCLFPEPGKEKEIDELFEKLGKVDLCLTGVGINGHIAFNEPPAVDEDITDEEYMNIGTRCLDIAKETIVNNGSRKIWGALDIFPKRCITLGMKQLLSAKVLKVYLYLDWQWGIMRKMSLEEPTRFAPVSFLQLHENSEMVITNELLNHTF